jgi:hypothetical protein
MRTVVAMLVNVALAGLATVAAQDKKPPERIVFPSKQATTFLHARHIERENVECTSCHDKLLPKSTAEGLKSSAIVTKRTARRLPRRGTARSATPRTALDPESGCRSRIAAAVQERVIAGS